MTPTLRRIAPALAVALMASMTTTLQAEEFTDSQRSEIEAIIKDYLFAKPEVMEEAYAELNKRRTAEREAKQKAAVAEHREALFESPHQVTLGNPDGDVTLVEFYDYNCPYCKRAASDLVTLLESDPDLKVVLKELPLLGEGSTDAAKIGVAVRMQDASGEKYWEYHKKLLSREEATDRDSALAVAVELGLDKEQIEKDMAGEEAEAALAESKTLSEALVLNGTPSYVIGDQVVSGAVGLAALQEKIAAAREKTSATPAEPKPEQ